MENTNIKNEKEKQPKTPKELTLFILRIVGNVLFYSAIAVLFFFSLMNINAGRKNGIPNIFGNGYLRVLTNSMHVDEGKTLPEAYSNYKIKQFNCTETKEEEGKTKILYKGDVVNVSMLGKKGYNKLKVGDVITYWDDDIEIDNTKGGFNTHRVTYIHKGDDGKVDVIYTIGDRDVSLYGLKDVDSMSASERYDYENEHYVHVFGESNFSTIKAKVTSVNYKAGYTIYWIQQNWLFIFVIPLAVILAIEVALVVRNIILLRKEKNKAATPEGQGIDLESEKERLRRELLAELQSQGVIATAPAEAATEEKVEEPKVEETSAVEAEEPTVEEAKAAPAEEPTEETKEPETEEVKEETPAEPEEVKEEVKEEKATEEAPVEEAPVAEEATKEEEPVVNNEEAVKEPDMSIEENEEEPKAEEKKTPVKKAPSKKTSTTKKASTTKKTEK